jgi:parvulin-like peptidyl-prolyl isomerase
VIALLLITLVFSSCKKEKVIEKDVIAQIEEFKVTEQHFKNAFKKYYYKTGRTLTQTAKTKKAVLDSEFDTYVLAVYARDQGINKLSSSIEKYQEIRRRVLAEEYKERYILADVEVTERDMEEVFVRFNTTFEAAHLYAPNKSIADSLYIRVKNGETFKELAKEVFQNNKLAESGGYLGRFKVDEMDLAFEDAIFSMKEGEISEPVKTAQGYSIIKVISKFTKPILTEYEFASKKDQFRAFAHKQKMERKTREHMYEFTNQLQFNDAVVDELWNSFSIGRLSFDFDDPETQSVINKDENLTDYNGYHLKKGEFITEASLTAQRSLNLIRSKDQFKNFITGLAYRDFMMEKAAENNLEEIEEIKGSIEYTWQVYLAQQASDRIRESITISDTELRKAYGEDRSRFYKPLEVNTARIVVNDEEQGEVVLNQLNKGVSFERLVDQYSVDNEERLRNGEMGYQTIKDFGFFAPKISSLQKGEVSDVLFYQTSEYHIYKILDRIESRPLSFKEAKPSIEDFLIRKKFRELRAETIESVKLEHNAYVNFEKLEDISIQI